MKTQPIRAKELRTGNIIHVLKDMNKATVTNIYGLSGLVDAKETESGMLHPRLSLAIGCNPIPLTPEWLERFGFEKVHESKTWDEVKISDIDGEYMYWISGMYYLTQNGEWWSFYHSTDEDTYWQIHHNVQYVHQLQNLYFALTGQELIYKI